MKKCTDVLVIDSSPIVQLGLRDLVENMLGARVVGGVGTISEADELLKTHKSEMIIMDTLDSTRADIDQTLDFVKRAPGPVVMFTGGDNWHSVQTFLNAGAMGFVSKGSPITDLIAAIKAAANYRQWVSPELRNVSANTGHKAQGELANLSPREREVALLVGRGLTSRQIADQLCISLKTVESHRYRIFKKLKIRHCAQLAGYAIKNSTGRYE